MIVNGKEDASDSQTPKSKNTSFEKKLKRQKSFDPLLHLEVNWESFPAMQSFKNTIQIADRFASRSTIAREAGRHS